MTCCQRCTRESGTYLCKKCVAEIKHAVQEAAVLAGWSDDKRARRGTNWNTGGSRAAEKPLPYDPRITPVVRRLARALAWAAAQVGPVHPGDNVARLCLQRLGRLARHPRGWHHLERVLGACSALQEVMDNPPERRYLGRCSAKCDTSLYVDADTVASVVQCPACKEEHPVQERIEWLEAQVPEHLATVREISRLLRHIFENDVSEKVIRRYASKGIIASRGSRIQLDKLGRRHRAEVYRIGDVMDVVATRR